MSAVELVQAGQLDEALQSLQNEVRRSPAEARHRVFLFQLLAVMGRWDRALTQLNVAADLDPSTLTMAQAYREILQCEALRDQIFSGKRSPLIFGEPADWIAQVVEALRLEAAGDLAGAAAVRAEAFDQAPATRGAINGEPFEWIADADSRLGPLLELIVNGRYYWVPFDRIRRITAEAPADLRDTVWMPVSLTWSNGGEAVGFIPTRYPGTTASADGAMLLARRTDWVDAGAGTFRGLGQRMFATGDGDHALLDLRSMELDAAPPASEDAA